MKTSFNNHVNLKCDALESYEKIIYLCQSKNFQQVANLLRDPDFPHESICKFFEENYYSLQFTNQKNKPFKDKSFFFMQLFYFPELRKIMNKEEDSLTFAFNLSALGQKDYITENYSNTLIQDTFYFEALTRDWIYRYLNHKSSEKQNNAMSEIIYNFYIDRLKQHSINISTIRESYLDTFMGISLFNFYKQIQYPFFYSYANKTFHALNLNSFILKHPLVYTHQIYSNFFKDFDSNKSLLSYTSDEQDISVDTFSFVKRLFSVNHFIKKYMNPELRDVIYSTDSFLSISSRILSNYSHSFAQESKNDFFWEKMKILIAKFNYLEGRDLTYDIFLNFSKSEKHMNALFFEECALKKYFDCFCDNKTLLDKIYLTNGFEIIPENIDQESLTCFRTTMMSKTINQQKAALSKAVEQNINVNTQSVSSRKVSPRL